MSFASCSDPLPCQLAQLAAQADANHYMPDGVRQSGFFYTALDGAESVCLLSDVHLHYAHPENFEAWVRCMHSGKAQAIVLLGDIFDVWIGDDLLTEQGLSGVAAQRQQFAQACVKVLRDVVEAGTAVYVMHGNRDFLLGLDFLRSTGCKWLPDPTVWQPQADSNQVQSAQEQIMAHGVWSHGDALCLEDVAYQSFRQQVRSAEWQRDFLNRPIAERMQIADAIRVESQTTQAAMDSYADADVAMTRDWLQTAGANILIHGHTHRPAVHVLPDGKAGAETSFSVDCAAAELRRYVLSDWEQATSIEAKRGDALLLTAHKRSNVDTTSSSHCDIARLHYTDW